MNILQVLKLQKRILTSKEKRHFKIISAIFLFASLFDIVGIGAIGYFLLIIIQPSMIHHLPIIGKILPASWSSTHILAFLGGMILGLFLFKTVIGFFSQKILIEYCFKVGARIRAQLMDHYLYAPYIYFVEHNTADVINQILMSVNNYTSLNLSPLMLLIVHSIFITAILLFLCLAHPLMTLIMVVMLGGALVLNVQFSKDKLYRVGLKINQTNKQIVQAVQEAFIGLKEMRVLGKEGYFMRNMESVTEKNAKAYGFVAVFQRLPLYFIESMMFVFIITLCLMELLTHTPAQLIVANCGILVVAAARLLPSVYQVATSVTSIYSSNHSLQTIYQNIVDLDDPGQAKNRWPNDIAQQEMASDFSIIALASVSYCYPESHRLALDSISLSIQKGQSIGIVGASGAGKSTLVDVLLGLLLPQSGEILLDGKPIPKRNQWVKNFAYIPQTVHLLDGSVKKNIIFEDDNIAEVDTHQLDEAIKMAQLEEVINSLPNGIDTVIGENGIRLSGGQRQRIALARTFYHQREVIIMDEATSALDNETELEVVNAIKRLHKVKTLIIIAHRYSTVEHCDKIYRLAAGKIVECGSFENVILKK